MLAENQNTVGPGQGGSPSQPAHVPPATTQPAQVPPGTARQRDWAEGEAKEFAASQDAIVSGDWPEGGRKALVDLLDLANDAWDEKDLAVRRDKTKTVLEIQQGQCCCLMGLIYHEFDRLGVALACYKDNPRNAAAGQGPAENEGGGSSSSAADDVIKWDRKKRGELEDVFCLVKNAPGNDERSWEGFYTTHKAIIRARLAQESVRYALDGTPKRPQFQAAAAAESVVQQNGQQLNGQQNDRLSAGQSAIRKSRVGEAQDAFWGWPADE